MQVARMPDVSWDRQRGRFVINWRFPKQVHALTGPWFRHRFPRNTIPTQADRAEKLVEYTAIIDAAVARLATPDGLIEAADRLIENTRIGRQRFAQIRETLFPVITARLGGMDEAIQHNEDRTIYYRAAGRLGIDVPIIDVTPATVVRKLDEAIGYWKKKHGAWPDTDAGRKAEKKAEAAKRRAAGSLFVFAGTDNMAAIPTETIQKWKDDLDGRVAHDYVADVKTLYGRLKANHRFPKGMENPAADIEIPTKPKHKPRNEFSHDRAKLILESAAKSENPIIKWGPLIMAHQGMIPSEIVYAPTSEIHEVHGVMCWHVGENRDLKTGNRPRVLPLHDAVVESGFLDYVRSRGDSLLFDIDNDKASGVLMAHLRGLGIEGDDQVNYSWRHGFISRLVNNGVDPTLRRYLDGHGLGHIDEKHYIHHNMANMVAAIRLIEPTKPYAMPVTNSES
jgi:integrase